MLGNVVQGIVADILLVVGIAGILLVAGIVGRAEHQNYHRSTRVEALHLGALKPVEGASVQRAVDDAGAVAHDSGFPCLQRLQQEVSQQVCWKSWPGLVVILWPMPLD